jgi:lysophospholipase L1-like esterase
MPQLICFGDSITQGRIGSSYVDMLRIALPGVDVVNRGIDGDTTYNLLTRIDRDVIAHQPDLVSVMIGLNDFGTAYGEPISRFYYRTAKKVPVAIDIPAFEAFYAGIIQRLQHAGIPVVLFTQTTIDEIPDTPAQALLDGYVHVVYRLAAKYHLPVIDVRAAFVAAMRNDPRNGPKYHLLQVARDEWNIQRGATTYAQITDERGFNLVVDGVHLSEAGARLVAQTVLPTLKQLLNVDG